MYSILSERLWEKSIVSIKSKKYLTDFTGMEPVASRNSDEAYLSDDVSFIIAHNKKQMIRWKCLAYFLTRM